MATTARPMSPEAARRLLAELEATHGPDVLAALLAAALSSDVAAALDEQEPDDEPPAFDREWAGDFFEHPAFVAALSPEAMSAIAE